MSYAFSSLLNDFPKSSNVNTGIQDAINNIEQLYALTGSEYFKHQLDGLKSYVKDLPEDKCIAWGVNKKQFDAEPVPLPEEPLYGLLQIVPDFKKDKEALCPEYTVRIFRDLEQAKRTESASIVQFRNTMGNGVLKESERYHPALYRIKFEPVDKTN